MSKCHCCNVWTLESVCEGVGYNLGRKKGFILAAFKFVQHDFQSQNESEMYDGRVFQTC